MWSIYKCLYIQYIHGQRRGKTEKLYIRGVVHGVDIVRGIDGQTDTETLEQDRLSKLLVLPGAPSEIAKRMGQVIQNKAFSYCSRTLPQG
ncbi:hypothetical protein MPTK1_7g05730 [Marchantia polymorpha subsp. ruderalis]|uniref:Uncharacterized protein n=2 Tax=Marchantia polymorpha TaxID=3197 RepID=A0AAF6BWI5_MARPO|nr:hypothetical protein MARPO_0057s0098 [Marchantia polymorpha]BBN16369.1 hypothetical protein Mp_7g05730 [Marchantia polymorpha subsp. ruderalis]|eukprot:PTQ37488.1 hypothetical protein MARPO_0057s0098 [Marchantia polymorpha]